MPHQQSSLPKNANLKLDSSQTQAINYQGDNLLIVAGAATGKTTILVKFAEARPNERMLYIAFNKAIQQEAETRFPRNVVCRTIHSIAFRLIGKNYSHKLTGSMRVSDVRVFLGNPSWELVNNTIAVFNNFLASSDTNITTKHAGANSKYLEQEAVSGAKRMWTAATDTKDPFPITHDVYLKLYCLAEPEMHQWFDYILLDEAQDTNPVSGEFVMAQKCKKVLVGDDHQQLYRWRGASNAMGVFKKRFNADVCFLTQSFRFGKSVANMANAILSYKSKLTGCDEFTIKGLPSINDKWVKAEDIENKPHASLHRTVMGALETALKHPKKSIWWIGGLENYNVQELVDVYNLSVGDTAKVKRKKLLVEFKTYSSYKHASENSGDAEMVRAVKMIDSYGKRLPSLIQKMRTMEVKSEGDADLIIGTIHRSKGLEFPRVRVSDDFRDILDPTKNYTNEVIADELNLLYVACTRAIFELASNQLMYKIFYIANPEDKKHTMVKKSYLPKKNRPPKFSNPVPIVND